MSFMSAVFAPTPGLAGWLGDTLARIECYRRARLERRQLLGLGERELRDIGLSRVDAMREADKSLWLGCSSFELRRPQP